MGSGDPNDRPRAGDAAASTRRVVVAASVAAVVLVALVVAAALVRDGGSDAATADPSTTAGPEPTPTVRSELGGDRGGTGPATTAPPPSVLVATPARLDLGGSAATGTVTIRNDGPDPVGWTASADGPSVAPAAGHLDAGATAVLTVTIDRAGLVEADHDWPVTLAAADGTRLGSFAVVATVDRPPQVTATADRSTVTTAGPAACRTVTIVATVADESGLAVRLRWATAADPDAGDVAMTTAADGSWRAAITAPATPSAGPIRWQVVATDGRGNETSTPEAVVAVSGGSTC